MIIKSVLQIAVACAVFAASLSATADTFRINYALNSKMPINSGGGEGVPPDKNPDPEEGEDQYIQMPYSRTYSTGLGHGAVVSGFQGTYSAITPNKITITGATFVDMGGSGYESIPKIISQGCTGEQGAYTCYFTVELRDDSGVYGGASPWEAVEYGVDGQLYVNGYTTELVSKD